EAGFSALLTLNRKAPEKIASKLADFLLAQGAGAYHLRAAVWRKIPARGLEARERSDSRHSAAAARCRP
ncbi:MAG: hypothetical protein IJV89_06710, partial [Lentisphaeria bacterium]|nr:hypothetical protein [Lentisphaeria bacterium]